MKDYNYCNDLINYSRLKTREVLVGNVGIGSSNPIRIQSMTTTDTLDTTSTVKQSIRMIEAGSELVRITAPSLKEARNLKNIKNELVKKGFNTPLVADIHFTPSAAEVAAQIVEKVRINPGNYVDRKNFKTYEYSNQSYNNELERIRNKFLPLIYICKDNSTAMRIGTNHGSLSDRIMSRYGDTPLGMVESAMEFLRICKEESYNDIIISMKSSNTQVMIQAYRLLVQTMLSEGMDYPLHLGVTEAGEAEDGRIKSSLGIGSLLDDGIGDTIRVSLTEEPEKEIPVAKAIVSRYSTIIKPVLDTDSISIAYNPYFREKRDTRKIKNIGGDNVPIVIGSLSNNNAIDRKDLIPFGYLYSSIEDKWHISDQAIDYLYIGDKKIDFSLPGTLSIIQNNKYWLNSDSFYPVFKSQDFNKNKNKSRILNFIMIDNNWDDNIFDLVKEDETIVLISDFYQNGNIYQERKLYNQLLNKSLKYPIVIKKDFNSIDKTKFLIDSSIEFGSLLVDGFGDGVWCESRVELGYINEIIFSILQAARVRTSKTEYISCPSCGRTLFDLQETTSMIRSKTNHLKGLKIGIMGCIVNGPGEMADADYGYVGTGLGKVSLYKGQNVVMKNISAEFALEELIKLIKLNGDWVELV